VLVGLVVAKLDLELEGGKLARLLEGARVNALDDGFLRLLAKKSAYCNA